MSRRAAATTAHTSEAAPVRLCRLASAIGETEACPYAGCPFWEEGGAVVPAGCMLDRLAGDLDRRPELALALLPVRRKLEQVHDQEDEAEAYALVFRLLRRARDEGGEAREGRR